MTKKYWAGMLLALTTLCLWAQPSDVPLVSGQSTAPADSAKALVRRSPAERDRASRKTDHIILDVIVTDASGRPVSDLQEKDFTLRSNQQPQQIVSFKSVEGRTAQPPAHVIFMLDVLNNSFQQVSSELGAVKHYLHQHQERLSFPVSIAVLTESGVTLGLPSRDANALIDQLKRVPMPLATLGTLEGSNARRFHSSVQSLTRMVTDQEDVPGRVILIWMGPGWPLLSDGPYPGTAMDKNNFFGAILNLSSGFLDAQMTVDAVSSPNMVRDRGQPRGYYKPFLRGAQRADQADPADLALPILAYQSGGQVFEDDKDMVDDITRCIADLESYYVLSFDSPHATSDIEYRKLQIVVHKPGVTPRTNAFYYAQP